MKRFETKLVGYYTTNELCEALGVSPTTARNWQRAGLIKYVNIGNMVLYPAGEVERMDNERPQRGGIPYSRNGKLTLWKVADSEGKAVGLMRFTTKEGAEYWLRYCQETGEERAVQVVGFTASTQVINKYLRLNTLVTSVPEMEKPASEQGQGAK